jgi:hypothetical protein
MNKKEMEKQHFLLLKKAFLFGFLPMMSSLLILHLWLGLFSRPLKTTPNKPKPPSSHRAYYWTP